jgi:hypothetical protein
MIGAAEEMLWPATRVRAAVAIIHPRSAEYWDMHGVEFPDAMQDGGNNDMDAATVDYFSEAHGLYDALAVQQNVPVDFVDEVRKTPSWPRSWANSSLL